MIRIAFLIDSVVISGGINVIFEHATRLQELGHSCTIIMPDSLSCDRHELAWFPKAKTLNWITYNELSKNDSFDIAIATWWKTFYKLSRVSAKHYVYFVQSIESRFYNEADRPLKKLVEATYMLDIPIITEATWIQEYLKRNYNANVQLVKNGINKDIFRLDGECIQNKDPNKLRVLVEGPLDVPFKNVPKTIKLCRNSNADEVWLLTSTPVNNVLGVDRVFSQVPIEKTADIYRSCDVIVKLSYVEGMFGPPLEMFHCGGTAITYDVTGYDEYLAHNKNSLVAKTDDDEAVIFYINQLKKDNDLIACLKRGAIQTASDWYGWDKSTKAFESALLNIIDCLEVKREMIKVQTEFLDDWYLLSEMYRKRNSELSKIKGNLKEYLKKHHPNLFLHLKKGLKTFSRHHTSK